ncbi:MAG: AI-2E family transporter [Oscillospiraceae bacterium]|nr:AI-2E family transporter [Oscillospiraceae bacterium]
MRRYQGDKKYLYWGITAFCVVAASILFFMLLQHLPGIRRFLRNIAQILSPFILGLIIAYFLLPLKKRLNTHVFKPFTAWLYKKSKRHTGKRLASWLSVFVCMLALLAVLTALFYLIIPQLYSSIKTIVDNSNTYIATTDAWLRRILDDYPTIEAVVLPKLSTLSKKLIDWAQNTLLPNVASSVTTGVISVFRATYNVVVGIIVSVYILLGHENMGAGLKKLLYSLFRIETVQKLVANLDFTNKTFMSFFGGKIIDSAIIALLCYIGTSILRIPYALLVSAIVGVTNIIPFFGPFIGAIPCAFIILIIAPMKCLIFILFVVILQQLDGNIIGPRILGNSVGINGFWVMFSIILGAGLFGFWGMLLGVPIFVVVYTIISRAVNRRLKLVGLTDDTDAYRSLHHIDPETKEFVKKQKQKKPKMPAAAAPTEGNENDSPPSP